MKQSLNLTFSMLTMLSILVTSCSTSIDAIEPETGKANNQITINGSEYATVVIGKQTWTSINYNGTGGINYNNGANDPSYGKLYTIDEARAIALPAGWRLPSREDYNTLLGTLGESAKDKYGYYIPSPFVTRKLLAITSWNNILGKNESGFNAIATGHFRDLNRSSKPGFQNKSIETVFVTTSYFTELGGNWAQTPISFRIYSEMSTNTTEILSSFSDAVERNADAGSLRFVKDN